MFYSLATEFILSLAIFTQYSLVLYHHVFLIDFQPSKKPFSVHSFQHAIKIYIQRKLETYFEIVSLPHCIVWLLFSHAKSSRNSNATYNTEAVLNSLLFCQLSSCGDALLSREWSLSLVLHWRTWMHEWCFKKKISEDKQTAVVQRIRLSCFSA